MKHSIEVIAHVRTPFVERFGTPRQPGVVPAAEGRVVFEPAFRDVDAVRGLEDFSHVWLTFIFDRVADRGWKPLVRPPRLGGNAKVGVWATRSPFRPNSLGLSLVELKSVEMTAEGPVLRVGGVDLTDQTPIVDIKPYLPYAEAVPEATAGWAQERPAELAFAIAASAEESWARVDGEIRELVSQVVTAHPAPAYQNGEKLYRVEIAGYSIAWEVENAGVVLQKIERITQK